MEPIKQLAQAALERDHLILRSFVQVFYTSQNGL